jgi:hypothetical protein
MEDGPVGKGVQLLSETRSSASCCLGITSTKSSKLVLESKAVNRGKLVQLALAGQVGIA